MWRMWENTLQPREPAQRLPAFRGGVLPETAYRTTIACGDHLSKERAICSLAEANIVLKDCSLNDPPSAPAPGAAASAPFIPTRLTMAAESDSIIML